MSKNIVNLQNIYWHPANRSCVDRSCVDRSGVTLIELLVVIGVLGFLAGLSLFALRGAQNDARAARTRGTITKLNDIILQQWEEYRYRAVDLRMEPGTTLSPRLQAHFRMLALRDMMRMEMPDRVTDLLYGPALYSNAAETVVLQRRAYPQKFGLLYQALASAINNSDYAGQLTLPPNPLFLEDTSVPPAALFNEAQLAQWNAAVQPSELLYLIVANSSYGGTSALEYFRPSEIGDPDGDGLLEFIDAWGNPIQWIRWPAGYPSDLNRYSGTDAMDPLQTDWRYRRDGWLEADKPQTIVPLIVSAGPDEQFGVTFGFGPGGSSETPIIYARMRQGFGSNRFYIDPFFTWDYQSNTPNGAGSEPPFDASHVQGYRANQLGSIPNLLPDGGANTFAADNITNHDIILGY